MKRHSAIREGIIAGVIGATAVAAWFFIVDIIAGNPFYTPEVLGRGVLSVLGPPGAESPALVVAFYTLIHYAAFIFIGVLAAAIVHATEKQPSLLAGALILFVAAEVAFYGFTAMLAETDALGTLAWYQIGLANLLAAILMGGYLWRTHPAIGGRLSYVLGGGEK